jgi:protoheme IX farnesyltransferase
MIIAAFVFLWQIPHVFLLHLKFQNEFELARMPLFISNSNQLQNRKLVFYWILATVFCTLLFPLFYAFNKRWLDIILLAVNMFVLFYSFYCLFLNNKTPNEINNLMLSFHFYQLIIFALIIIAVQISRNATGPV